MRTLIGLLSLALLVGCTGPKMKEARANTPNKVLSSSKAGQVVAQCVQFAWQDEAVFGVDASAYLEPREAGAYTVYTRGAEYFVDVTPSGAATTVSYYVSEDNWFAKRRLAALATCL